MKEKFDYYDSLDMDLTITTIESVSEKRHQANWSRSEVEGRLNHGLAWVLDGVAQYDTPTASRQLSEDTLLYLPQGSVYKIQNNSPVPFHYILINFKASEESPSLSLMPLIPTCPASPNFYFQIITEIQKHWFHKERGYRLKCKILMHDFFYHFLTEIITKEMHLRNFSRVEPAVRHMEVFYSRQITIEELSAITNLSVSRFRDVFKEIYGISPLKYLNKLRINKAQDLLQSEMYSVTEVSELTGFTNVYYFSRVFKKITGKCPSASA